MKSVTNIALSILAAALLLPLSETHPVAVPARLKERYPQYSSPGGGFSSAPPGGSYTPPGGGSYTPPGGSSGPGSSSTGPGSSSTGPGSSSSGPGSSSPISGSSSSGSGSGSSSSGSGSSSSGSGSSSSGSGSSSSGSGSSSSGSGSSSSGSSSSGSGSSSSGSSSSGSGSSSSGSSGSGSSSSSPSSSSSGSGSSSSGSGSSSSGSSGSGSSSSSPSSSSSGSGSSSSGSGSSSSGSSGSGSSSSSPSSSSSNSGSSSSSPSSSNSGTSTYDYSGSDSASASGGDVPQPMASDSAYDVADSASDTTCTAGVAQEANTATQNFMKGYETFQDSPYDDGYGKITVGYGHLCADATCSGTGYTYPMSETDASTLFSQDIQKYETCLTNALTVPLNANQYGALVSWTFNAGCGSASKGTGMAGSTLISRLNAGEDPNTVAAEELPKWNKAGGQVSQGLTNRRAGENNLFDTPTTDQGTCPSAT